MHSFGIGSQRSGTTWIYHNMRQHQEFRMPPVKEIHYFDRALSYPSLSHKLEQNILLNLFGSKAQHQHWRGFSKKNVRLMFRQRKFRPWELRWYLKYFFAPASDEWYKSLFDTTKHTCDITPTYAFLKEPDIKHLVSLYPAAKFFFVIRDPVDRAWSQYCLSVRTNRRKNDINTIKKILSGPEYQIVVDFINHIKTWQSLVSDRLYVAHYDDLKNKPLQFLNNLYAFLDVSPVETCIKIRINPSSFKMPEEIREFLSLKYKGTIVSLKTLFTAHN